MFVFSSLVTFCVEVSADGDGLSLRFMEESEARKRVMESEARKRVD